MFVGGCGCLKVSFERRSIFRKCAVVSEMGVSGVIAENEVKSMWEDGMF